MKNRTSFFLTSVVVFFFLFTLLGQLGSIFWFFDNFSAFYLQYGVILSLCLLYFLFARKWVMAAVAILPIFFIASFYLPSENALSYEFEVEKSYTIFHANVLFSNDDYDVVISEIRRVDPDIIVLQETTNNWRNILGAVLLEYKHGKDISDDFFSNMMVRSKVPLDDISYYPEFSTSVVELIFPDLRLLVTHPLAPVSKEFWKARNEQIEELSSFFDIPRATVMLGDFNIAKFSPYFDPLKDYYPDLERQSLLMTWPSFFPLLGTQIDHVFSNIELKSVRRGIDIGSDHYPLIIEL